MADVLMMTGPLEAGDLRALRELSGRLGARGFALRVLCVALGAPAPEGLEVVERPGLGSRWRRDWSVRQLDLTDGRRPALLHVLGADLAEAGLATAEHWELPYLLTIDEFLPPESHLRLSRRWARGVIASGEDLARDLVVQFGVPTRWVEVVPPGIVLPELPVVWPEATRVPVVGTSGDLAPGGGLTTFFDAARRLLREGLDVEFVVDGEGPDEALLRRLAVRLGIADRVTFAEDLDLLPVFWKVLDVYCQVSIVPDSGRTLGTALAHGIPAVVSDVPGLRGWVVHGETGLIVPPDRGRDLADALRVLLADRHQARAIGLRAREWAATHCDPEREADALAAAYRRALIEPTTVRSDAS